jgi:hypothetical protein
VSLAGENAPSTSGDPAKIDLMTLAEKSELDSCVAQAAQTAGDGNDRRIMIGVFIGLKGRPVSLAILESSGLERLDRLILRCTSKANFTPASPKKPPIQWVFTTSLKAKRVAPAEQGGEIAFLRGAVGTHVRRA